MGKSYLFLHKLNNSCWTSISVINSCILVCLRNENTCSYQLNNDVIIKYLLDKNLIKYKLGISRYRFKSKALAVLPTLWSRDSYFKIFCIGYRTMCSVLWISYAITRLVERGSPFTLPVITNRSPMFQVQEKINQWTVINW